MFETKTIETVIGLMATALIAVVRGVEQVEEVADPDAAALARSAHDAVNRSVVAYTGL